MTFLPFLRRRTTPPAPDLSKLILRIQELEGELAALKPHKRQRIALGMVVEKYAPGDVLGQWLEVLRRRYWPGPVFWHRAYNVVEGRNRITTRALERPPEDWAAFFWTDSDMLPDPGFADRVDELLEHPSYLDKKGGVIVGSYYNREVPFEVQLYEPGTEKTGARFLPPHVWTRALMDAKDRYLKRRPGRVIPVGGGGTGSMLIRRDVLERMQKLKGRGKVWAMPLLPDQLVEELRRKGEDKPGATWGEDVNFCIEVRRMLGIQVYADTDLRLCHGHVAQQIIGPDHYLAAHTVTDKVILDSAAVERMGYHPQVDAGAPAR